MRNLGRKGDEKQTLTENEGELRLIFHSFDGTTDYTGWLIKHSRTHTALWAPPLYTKSTIRIQYGARTGYLTLSSP